MTDAVDSWYSRVVVAVCFVIYFMNLGVMKISGLIYTDIISFYNVDRERASLPFLMASVMRSISGPLSGYLSYALGFRVTIVLGCIFSSFGIFACSFAQDIRVMCVFWTIYGFGCGLATAILPHPINVFNKKHATKANGIALCGASLAGIVLPFFTVALLNAYGMPGTFLNLSALMLNTIPGAILLRNPNFRPSKNNSLRATDTCKNAICAEAETMPEAKKTSNECLEISINSKTCFVSHCKDLVDSMPNQTQNRLVNGHTSSEEQYTQTHEESGLKAPIDGNDLEKGSLNSCQKLNMYPIDNEKKDIIKPKNQKYLQVLSILWDPVFLTFSLPRCMATMFYIIVPMIIVDFSIDKGVPKNQATYILMAFSLADMFGKLCLGWITDGNHMSRIRYAALWFCIVAFSWGLMAWSNGFVVMTIAVVLVAMGVATIVPTLFVLISHYFEKEKQSITMGFSKIFLLPLSFGSSSLIGYFRDHLGSYDGLVYILSATSILSAVLILLIPSISSWKMKRRENTPDLNT